MQSGYDDDNDDADDDVDDDSNEHDWDIITRHIIKMISWKKIQDLRQYVLIWCCFDSLLEHSEHKIGIQIEGKISERNNII